MKLLKYVYSSCLLVFIAGNSCSQTNKPADTSVMGTFVASTPCSEGTRPLPGIAADADCEFIRWNLTLYQDTDTKRPATYKLHYVYGLGKPGTPGFIDGGNQRDMKGKWEIVTGTPSNPHAIVYQLHDSQSNKIISFLKLNDDLLHLLDASQHLMVGSAAWSYTLNRTSK